MRTRIPLLAAAGLATALALSGCLGAGARVPAAKTDPQLAKTEKLTGPARERALYRGARKEGSVTWYTGLIPDQLVIPMKKAFEAKYPGVKLEYYRAGSSEIATKMLTEARARSPKSDIWDGAHAAEVLKSFGASVEYRPPTATDYPAKIKDKDGYWTAANIYIKGIAYNTRQVKGDDVPKTYEDLLKPRWKGQLAWTPEATGGADFIGNVLGGMGEKAGMAYLKKLAEQNPAVVQVSSRQLVNLAIAGQYPLVIQVFNNHVAISRKDGAPVGFAPLGFASEELNPMGLTAGSPHPYAGRLLLDFILSADGQRIFREADYIPADPRVKPVDPGLAPDTGGFKVNLITPHAIEKENAKWVDIFDELNG
ncbi:ABC transporter substrate-binding protein [Streptomyces sp. NPDC050560]|uniref:ABC transporter substrate-binding protein n=1 Tax=Streptomyces sp. NPDC050560 TaxID=3365630 RepID=UPI0037BC6240